MTDDTGLLQHAILTLPNYQEGYTTDDNARGLIASVLAESVAEVDEELLIGLESRYLAFLWYARDRSTNLFRNFLGFDRLWMEEAGSQDSNGRALWALGLTSARTRYGHLQESAAILFNHALPNALKFTYPRAFAFTLLGLDEYLRHFPGDRAAKVIRKALSTKLLDLYQHNSRGGWTWFEDKVTYSNARLSQALILSGATQEDPAMTAAGLESLAWLCRQQTGENGLFHPVGNRGWFPRVGEKASHDQQPVEANATVSAALTAYRVSGDAAWLDEAWRAFRWFLGGNNLGIQLYNPVTGGCRDGLHPDRVNLNEGAESTLSFLIALLEMQSIEQHDQNGREEERHLISLPLHHNIPGQSHG